MSTNATLAAAAISVVAAITAATVDAQPTDKKAIITFSQPVEIPGQVLAAGSYTFKLADSTTDRHIVQIFNADGSQIIATLLAIPNYRLTSTDETVITFRETMVGSPAPLRAWFYPGNAVGQEFVYPKSRAAQLARSTRIVVPAVAVEPIDVDTMKTAAIVAITPDEQEMPVALAIQTVPSAARVAAAMPVERRRLPQTADVISTVAVLGFVAVCMAYVLLLYSQRPRKTPARVRLH